MIEYETKQQERVEVRAVRVFGLGEKLIEVGEVITVSRSRGEYLKFLGLIEWL